MIVDLTIYISQQSTAKVASLNLVVNLGTYTPIAQRRCMRAACTRHLGRKYNILSFGCC